MKKTESKRTSLRFAALCICILIVGLMTAACGKDEGEQRYPYPLATASPEDTVTQIYAEKFAEEVDRLSDGRIKIQVYANSTLGGDRELLESCKDGDIPFVVQNTAPQVTFMPDLAIFDVPCAFENLDECREVLDDPAFSGLISSVYEHSRPGFPCNEHEQGCKKYQRFQRPEDPYHGEPVPSCVLEIHRCKSYTDEFCGGIYRPPAAYHRCSGEPVRGHRFQQTV